MNIVPGSEVGKYEVLEQLGQGAMATVYKVRHRQLNAIYALKVLQTAKEQIRQRLLTEGQVQASLRHPNVVGVSDVVVLDGHPGLVLEYVDGPDLDDFIRERHPLDLDEIDRIARGILKGVRAAHRAGHLHRDLKPANVMMARLDDEWVPKVADFGLAKVMGNAGGAVSHTRTGQIMGSPAYMAPEQCRDSKNVDERSDVFALGTILYELCTGRRAFDAPDLVAVFARIAAGACVPVHDLRPDLPERMVTAIRGAMVVRREQRIQDCDALLAVWSGKQDFDVTESRPEDTMAELLGADFSSSRIESGEVPSASTIDLSPAGELGPAAEPEVAPPDEAETSSGIGRLVVFGLVGLLGVGAVGVFGVGMVGAFVGGTLMSGSADVQPAVEQAPEPEPPVRDTGKPAPVAQPVAEPEPAPRPEPVVQPRPRPQPRPTPVPVQPTAPVPVQVAPDPVPVARSNTGTFSITGDLSDVWLVKDGEEYAPNDPVPKGSGYQIKADFKDGTGPKILPGVTVTILRGKNQTVNCSGGAWASCRVE